MAMSMGAVCGVAAAVRNDMALTIRAMIAVVERRIVMVTFPDTTLLDVVGPTEVFHSANELGRAAVVEAGAGGPAAELYELVVVSSTGGPVRASSGLVVDTEAIGSVE